MTTEERRLFEKLADHRAGFWKYSSHPDYRNLYEGLSDKYSEYAHFIYELLQNADDAGASMAHFKLKSNELLFKHNGTNHFSISDVDDVASGDLGSINSITAIAHSTKSALGNDPTIGKFGIGFKAVFQYTDTPHIYDTDFCFKIENYIIPVLLECDHPERKDDETLFVFPFDKKEIGQEKAFNEIKDKLHNLLYPNLFLHNLKELTFEIETETAHLKGEYKKTTLWLREFDDITASLLSLDLSSTDKAQTDKMWMFSKKLSAGDICVCFMVNENGRLVPCDRKAFCFFPTKEDTGLKLIIHAPFLLTDNRANIMEKEEHNKEMSRKLSELAASSLKLMLEIGKLRSERLIDDSILQIVPLHGNQYMSNHSMFLDDFYESMKDALKMGLLPTADGYTDSDHAYWADTKRISDLFSDEQLSDLMYAEGFRFVFNQVIRERKDVHWVFRTVSGSANDTNTDLSSYIKELTRFNYVDESKIAYSISDRFIGKQTFDWLYEFYEWLSESNSRFPRFKLKPIFINSEREVQAAYDEKGEAQLFQPTKEDMGCNCVHPLLWANETTQRFLIDIVKLKEPDTQDYIYNKIIPQYRNGCIPPDAYKHFQMFFDHFNSCKRNDAEHFIEMIKECAFLKYYDSEQNEHFAKASDLYLPTSELKEYFLVTPSACFIAYNEYIDLVGTSKIKDFDDFLDKLGINNLPKLKIVRIDHSQKELSRRDVLYDKKMKISDFYESLIDGCIENINTICLSCDIERSVMLWNMLCKIIRSSVNVFCKQCHLITYYRYDCKHDNTFWSLDAVKLRRAKWLYLSEERFATAENLTTDQLDERYDTKSSEAQDLLSFLCIYPPAEPDDNLTDEQREDIALARMFKEMGIDSPEKAAEFKKWYDQQEAKKAHSTEIDGAHSDSGNEGDTHAPDLHEENQDGLEDYTEPSPTLRDISHKKKAHSSYKSIKESDTDDDVSDADEDDYIPREVDYEKRIEREKKKVTREVEKLDRLDELQKIVLESKRYSYGWFKALLEMEALSNNESSNHSREINITFSRVEREKDSQRILVLKHPDRYIPHTLEEMADIPLHLQTDDQVKTVYIEVSSIKAYTLRVKLKNSADIEGFDLDAVKSATIKAQSPTFLLEALMDKFCKLGFDDDFDMQENLCENIEFIFGPPGTGKTTHLARNVLLPLMRDNSNAKVLVLTPTNKAADVIASRIMQEATDKDSYMDWLVRFGVTGDEEIENSGVFRDRSFDFAQMRNSVVVTTIARFAYDHVIGAGKVLPIDYIKWDYIIIDEASMIPLVNIIYPLYKKTPKKFYIAGDPFQIEPISAVSLWKDENIYKLVQLDSFVSPATIPHDYPVTLLKTQYRSVPSVGTVFSKLTYGGILAHYREEDSAKDFNIDDGFFELRSLNIIKFPVSRYESIYRSKKLQNSNYQIYSALFTFEFAVKLANLISKSHDGNASIGIIAPYRAQADLLDKLIASENIPDNISLEAGTIHGFQGDECDIVIALFNTPPKISSSKEVFLNKKNIINVSVSRARDSLIMIMPDDDTENVDKLELIKRVEQYFSEQKAAKYSSSDLEEWMFGSKTYLEDNSFATGHQNVNVYGLPEKIYEIRTEDTAVDIQIHRRKESDAEAAESDTQQNDEPEFDDSIVISPKYGTGRIISHRDSQAGLVVDVMFDDGTVKSFIKEQAFSSGALKLRKR